MQISFTGKTALVTGAGSGIGESIATDLARAGARVVVADIDFAKAEVVAERIVKDGGQAQPGTGDVADPAAVEALVAEAVAMGGGLDLLVNNAGIGGPLMPLGEYPLDGWRRVMGVNLDGVFYGMRYAIPEMLKRGKGAIVNMASILGSVGYANAGAYVATKHALLGLTKTAALEYAAKGIRVNAVGPAFIETPLLANLPADVKQALAASHPIGRIGRPEEVSALTLFLLSDQASFINGSYHLVDGGYCAQ
ncbi:SDR family oxidoreductase [Aliigemmobacter aestuarii]|uniref:SDR family oxidoreductase n=1 Tax=Aliigemmobacter aestuarii TaxID=1445661 RepID=A0A4S3MQF5_9RHOB|nr:SDR family NAD(P)-dependent oxidoreductase [Gemmobacter aestuarii]THD84679.1 SDR family oxidoreductase [Gemmobacter aestuarii]